ncbi:hypothetical protein [Streptomyces rimosus]|uniref:hypothetical protein n=1 Tax=Streptomyces rimosus TaxID=1927 RepID=UPI0037D47516
MTNDLLLTEAARLREDHRVFAMPHGRTAQIAQTQEWPAVTAQHRREADAARRTAARGQQRIDESRPEP